MLPLGRFCLRTRGRLSLPTSITPSIPLLPTQIRTATTKRKKKVKPGEFQEKDADRRLRLKRKREKELDKKRKRFEKVEASKRAQFKLPPYTPRPDAVPFGTGMRVLRGWHARQEIFVRSTASGWTGETKVVAAVRIVPNEHNPRGVKGRVQFPHPVVFSSKEGKKERIAAIVEGDEADAARAAGMIVGGKEYLDQIVKMVSENQSLPFDILIATPSTASFFKQHGRVLGPKGLMPSEKRGTVVTDFTTYGTREEKGIELKLDGEGKTKKGATLRVVVGKLKQDDREIQANVRALINTLRKITANTQIPLELFIYSTLPPFVIRQHPHLQIQKTVHQPTSPDKLQRPNTVYPPDRANHLSNASFLIPIASFPGVGHPKHLRPQRVVRRYVAGTQWTPALGNDLQLAKYKAGIQELEKKKLVHKWQINRTKEDVERERKEGVRRSGDLEQQSSKPKKLVL